MPEDKIKSGSAAHRQLWTVYCSHKDHLHNSDDENDVERSMLDCSNTPTSPLSPPSHSTYGATLTTHTNNTNNIHTHTNHTNTHACPTSTTTTTATNNNNNNTNNNNNNNNNNTTIKGHYTLDDVALHASATDLWVVISEEVYDVTAFINKHPG